MTFEIPVPYLKARQAIIDSSKSSAVYIGCDSIRKKRKGLWYANFSTVIIIHRDSCHGGNIFYHTVSERDYGNLKARLLREVGMAVEAATTIIDVVDDRHMEVHLDINPDPKHASNIAVKEAIGWVQGMGFEAKVKPDSFAATHAADHCVRHFH